MSRNLKKSYWGGNGKYQILLNAIQKFVPDRGHCIDDMPCLEEFRLAQNAYHDLLNNGGGNRDALILKLAGKDLSDYNIEYGRDDPCGTSAVVNYSGDLCLCKEVNSEDFHHTIYHLWCLCEKALHLLVLAAAEEILHALADDDGASNKFAALRWWCEGCHQGYETAFGARHCFKSHKDSDHEI